MDLNAFEAGILSLGGIDPAQLQRGDPLKSPQELKNEWLQQRLGKFTASEFHRLMASSKNDELPKGAQTYATEKAVELLTAFQNEEPYISLEMQWGIDHELEAIRLFTEKTGKTVEFTGINQQFVQLGDDIGCTPDGLIGKTVGIEVKCPKSTTHLQYLRINTGDELKKLKPEYYWQIQGSMFITKRRVWYFVSFDPRYKNENLRLKILRIERNPADIKLLKRRLSLAVLYRDRLIMEANCGIAM